MQFIRDVSAFTGGDPVSFRFQQVMAASQAVPTILLIGRRDALAAAAALEQLLKAIEQITEVKDRCDALSQIPTRLLSADPSLRAAFAPALGAWAEAARRLPDAGMADRVLNALAHLFAGWHDLARVSAVVALLSDQDRREQWQKNYLAVLEQWASVGERLSLAEAVLVGVDAVLQGREAVRDDDLLLLRWSVLFSRAGQARDALASWASDLVADKSIVRRAELLRQTQFWLAAVYHLGGAGLLARLVREITKFDHSYLLAAERVAAV